MNQLFSLFLHTKRNFCNQLLLTGVTASAGPYLPPPTPASHLSHPPPPPRSLIPTFPPAMIKGRWQIYTHLAAQAVTAFLRLGPMICKSHIETSDVCTHVTVCEVPLQAVSLRVTGAGLSSWIQGGLRGLITPMNYSCVDLF